MAGDDHEADLFAIPHLWQTSKWLDQLGPKTSTVTPVSPFFLQNLNGDANSLLQHAQAIEFPVQDTTSTVEFALGTLSPIALEQDGFFKLPALDLPYNDNANTQVTTSEETSAMSDSPAPSESTQDVWMGVRETSCKPAGFGTWDAFTTGDMQKRKPTFVSESGPAAFDALLSWPDDPLHLNNIDVPMVETGAYFSALLAMAQGCESVFFKRQDEAQSFKPTLPKMRISGYSRDALQGIEEQSLFCGSTMLELRSFVQTTYSTHSSRCGVALASSLSQVLQAVQERVAVHGRNPRSILQLQSTIRDVSVILRPFQRLVSQLSRGHADEDVLSLVFQQAYAVDNDEEHLRDIMREVLRSVSVPWIEFIQEWIGTKPEEGILITKSAVGASKGFVRVEAMVHTDDFGREVDDVDFRLDERRVPEFMPDDLMKSIFEAGRNLRFIKSFHPDHLLAQPETIASSHPPKSEWKFDWDSILRLEDRVEQYRDNLLDALHQSRSQVSKVLPRADVQKAALPSSLFRLDPFGPDQGRMEEQMLASIHHFDHPVLATETEDSLGYLVRERLCGTHQRAPKQTDPTPHWALLPTLSFGGIASVQTAIINKESLKLLFHSHDLRNHLKLQREFHLLRNGMLCSRLSHALFDPDLESAERQAGIARQGGVMGLRLGGRDTWPPASSELRLALMGVLTDSYGSTGREMAQPGGQGGVSADDSELPGDFSFAVRDLTSEEIDKCMDPDSLEALDFLRLTYNTPPELSSIITPEALTQYDRIFKLLLRVLRMLYVANQLFQDVNIANMGGNPSQTSYRFVREAQHFISSTASYFMNTGIGIPWQSFEDKLDEVEADLGACGLSNDPDKLQSPDQLRNFHSQVLDQIMIALFLRKIQQPVLKLLEEIFSCILRYAKYSRLQALGRQADVEEGQDAAVLYTEFKKKVQIFITVCRGLTEKGRMGNKGAETDKAFRQYGTGDESLVAHLLMKLDMFDYYCQR